MVERKSTATRSEVPLKDGPGASGASKSTVHERASASVIRNAANRAGSRSHASAIESDASAEDSSLSGGRAGISGSRAGASKSRTVAKISRSADSISAEIVEEKPATPIDAAALLRGDSLLFLVAAICATAFTLTELLTGHFRELGAGMISLILCAGLSWAAFAWRSRKLGGLWTAAIAISALNTMLPDVTRIPGPLMLSAILLVLVWSGMLLRPRWNLALAVYVLAALLGFGGEIVLAASQMSTDGQFALPVLMTFMAIPLGLGATLQVRQRGAEASVKASITQLERQREELQKRLQGKISELEQSREQLFEAQKLKTVGTMASGLAHELNNILTPIRGHAELIAEGSATTEQSRRYGQRILDSAAAAAQITGALLTYTRQGTFQPVRSNLRQLLQSQILPVTSKSLPGNVRLKVELARNVSVDVDRVLFQQAVTNLVYNASDAMPEGGEITIGLSTSSQPPHRGDEDDSDASNDDGIQRSAVITVADTGTGIDEEHIDQIFDPFFTTKPVGSGSGLGLAMVMGTVTRHHGRITVESVLGEGTTFTIYLPLAPAEEKEAHKPWPVLRGESKGPVVVVLTEDQDALDEFEELLEATECSPICTSDAKAATPLLTEMGDKVELLILDLEIEAVDASRLFRTVRELFPEMPVILLSNQPTKAAIQRLISAGPTRSVRKPMDGRLFSALLTDLLQPDSGYVRDFTPVPITPGADVSGPHPRAG
ncbi:ATP-binding protein [Nannocystaceae bacterium ST9]